MRVGWFAGAAALAGVAALAAVTGSPSSEPVSWAPPRQTSPTDVVVPAEGDFSRTFGPREDVILRLPRDQVKTGEVKTYGGRHVRLVGGHLGGSTRPRIIMRRVYGSAFIEGVELDHSRAQDSDAIVVHGYNVGDRSGWTYPDVYLQNIRVIGVHGTAEGEHADVFQKQGPIGRLFIDRLTATTNYQGIHIPSQSFQDGTGEAFMDGMASTDMRRVNLGVADGVRSGYLLWLGWNARQNPTFDGFAEDPWPIRLQDVWVNGKPSDTLARNLVFPRRGTVGNRGEDIGLIVAPDGLSATWEKVAQIDGTVRMGRPPGGDFVPPESAGLSYSSPGYR